MKKIREFLQESNNIEDIWDEDSLQQALYAWEYIIDQSTLTIDNILKTHKILMLHQTLQPDEKGYLRKVQVWIAGHEAKPWYTIPELIKHWIVNANDLVRNGLGENKKLLKRLAQEHHVGFESIHPFIDGNGRIGRILWQWQRVKTGLPVLVIKEKEKAKYYKWFN